jgi:hypothetical protein
MYNPQKWRYFLVVSAVYGSKGGETRQRHHLMKSQEFVKRVYVNLVSPKYQDGKHSRLSQLGSSPNIFRRNLRTVAHTTEDPALRVEQPRRGIEFNDTSGVHDTDPIVTDDSLQSICNRNRKPTVFHSQHLRSRTHEQYIEWSGLRTRPR